MRRIFGLAVSIVLALSLVPFSGHSAARAASPSAASTKKIRVMTYNIHVGVGMDKKLDLPRIAAVIKDQRADIVGLQEVDRGVERTGRIDEIGELAKLTHMDY